jgi:hypothetical protein
MYMKVFLKNGYPKSFESLDHVSIENLWFWVALGIRNFMENSTDTERSMIDAPCDALPGAAGYVSDE